jgi:carbon storage regulator
MLVLCRKVGQRIVVPHFELEVTVLAVDAKTVRLGISAPPAVAVHREEVWRRLRRPPPDSAAESLSNPLNDGPKEPEVICSWGWHHE